MKKKILSIALSLVMVMAMMPLMTMAAFASATEPIGDDLYLYEDGAVYTFDDGIKVSGNITIHNCTVNVPNGIIETTGGNITFDNATINVTKTSDSYDYGINAENGEVLINNSTVNVNMKDTSYDAIYAKTNFTAMNSAININCQAAGGISVENEYGQVHMEKCTLNVCAPYGDGVNAYRGSVLLSECVTEIDCGKTGICADATVTLAKSDTLITAGQEKAMTGGEAQAIFAGETVSIEGGSLVAASGYGNGIYANNIIRVEEGTEYVYVQGNEYALKSGNEYVMGYVVIASPLTITTPTSGRIDTSNGTIVNANGLPADKVEICGEVKSISKMTAKLSYTTKAYTGSALKPRVTIAGLTAGTDFAVSYSNNTKVGKATVKITGKGRYTGTITKTFTINPGAAVLKSLTPGTKKLTVKLSAKPTAKGGSTYQIYYRQKGTTTWKKTTTTASSKTILSLKKGKQYQVKVRAYKKVGTKTYYGAWSAVKTSNKIK